MSENQDAEYVVVAEDSTPNRTILVLLLKKMGYGVFECVDGAAAWSVLEQNTKKKIVAVISDIMMPNMDGLELLRRVRNEEKFKELPFLLVTAVSDKDYIFEARQLNVNGYILKPVTFQRVSTKMQEIFPDRKFPKLAG
jgi:two-component system chemotaxis response regulator CheY